MDGQMACAKCGRAVSGRFREIVGIEEVRKQGGQHAVIDRRTTGRYFCDLCIRDVRNGIPMNSPRLFPDERDQ